MYPALSTACRGMSRGVKPVEGNLVFSPEPHNVAVPSRIRRTQKSQMPGFDQAFVSGWVRAFHLLVSRADGGLHCAGVSQALTRLERAVRTSSGGSFGTQTIWDRWMLQTKGSSAAALLAVLKAGMCLDPSSSALRQNPQPRQDHSRRSKGYAGLVRERGWRRGVPAGAACSSQGINSLQRWPCMASQGP